MKGNGKRHLRSQIPQLCLNLHGYGLQSTRPTSQNWQGILRRFHTCTKSKITLKLLIISTSSLHFKRSFFLGKKKAKLYKIHDINSIKT